MSCLLNIPFVIPCCLCKYKEQCNHQEPDAEIQRKQFINFIKGENQDDNRS